MAIERIDAISVHSQSTPNFISVPVFEWVLAVSDASDATYIGPAAGGHFIRFNMATPVVITGADTINFITVMTRALKTGGGTARFRARQLDASSNFQEGASFTLTTGFTDNADQFNLTPTAGAWTLADFTGLTLQLNTLIFPAGFEMHASAFFINIDFTVPTPPGTDSASIIDINGNFDPMSQYEFG